MSKISFSDLLKAPQLRTFDCEIEGLGTVTLTELSGVEYLKQHSSMNDLHEAQAPENEHVNSLAFWASRLLKGSDPTKKEVNDLKLNVSAQVLGRIVNAGMSFNAENNSKEEIEKN